MNKQEIWDGLCKRHPEFRDDDYVLSQKARGLRNLINQAWDEGHTKGVANGRALEATEQKARERSKGSVSDLLKGFGPG